MMHRQVKVRTSCAKFADNRRPVVVQASMETPATKKMKNIAVFCGASPGNDPAYGSAADAMGKAMCSRGASTNIICGY